MKSETWLIIVNLIIILALAGIMAMNTVAIDRQEALAAAWAERDRLLGAAYWRMIKDLPPPYSPPLESMAISSGTGYRMDPMGGSTESLHKGVDLVGPIGTPVKAVLPGIVLEHWPPPDGYYRGHPVFGGMVVIDHGDGLFSLYGHLSATTVHEGWHVEAGQIIGELGDTGVATGPHLHWEIVIDPLRYFSESSGN